MHLNEAQTRAAYIDKQLGAAGWHVGAVDLEEEYEVASAGDAEHGFSDYVLVGKDGRPLAVVEAKRSARDAIAGKQQAEGYGRAIAEQTGTTPLIFLANGNEIWFWDVDDNPRLVAGFFPQADLERRRFQRDEAKPLADTEIPTQIVGRPYQHEAIRRAQEAFSERRRKALWVMATGSGKTRTAAGLIATMLEARWAQKILFLV
jgi:type I restriction enzyme, R subunit